MCHLEEDRLERERVEKERLEKEKMEKEKVVISTKPAPWCNIVPVKVNLSEIIDEEKNGGKVVSVKKEDAEVVSENKSNMEMAKKTRWCKNIVDSGYCRRKVCSFCHTEDEFEFKTCRQDKCYRKNCPFLHHWESVSDYKKRTNFTIPDKLRNRNKK